jgi:hypothetical protein
MDRYVSSLHKNTLAYNLCIHLEKCKTHEEVIETVGRILDNFEENRPEFLPCNTGPIAQRVVEEVKNVATWSEENVGSVDEDDYEIFYKVGEYQLERILKKFR